MRQAFYVAHAGDAAHGGSELVQHAGPVVGMHGDAHRKRIVRGARADSGAIGVHAMLWKFRFPSYDSVSVVKEPKPPLLTLYRARCILLLMGNND